MKPIFSLLRNSLLAAVVALTASSALAAKKTGAGADTAVRSASVARVNGVAIPASRLEALLQNALAQGAANTPELHTALKNRLIAVEVLRQKAIEQKLDNDAQVRDARDEAMIRRYLQIAVKPTPVGEQAVRARFEAIVASLGEREYKLRLMALPDDAAARGVLARLKTGQTSFEALAREHSLLPSRDSGGALDWISFKTPAQEGQTQGLPLPVANAAAALSPGAVTAEPIVWQGRHFLVQLDAVRPTKIPDYDAVAPTLRRALETQETERATAALMVRLLRAAHIEQ